MKVLPERSFVIFKWQRSNLSYHSAHPSWLVRCVLLLHHVAPIPCVQEWTIELSYHWKFRALSLEKQRRRETWS